MNHHPTNTPTNIDTNLSQPYIIINNIFVLLHVSILAHINFNNEFYENKFCIITVFNMINLIIKILVILFINVHFKYQITNIYVHFKYQIIFIINTSNIINILMNVLVLMNMIKLMIKILIRFYINGIINNLLFFMHQSKLK